MFTKEKQNGDFYFQYLRQHPPKITIYHILLCPLQYRKIVWVVRLSKHVCVINSKDTDVEFPVTNRTNV